MRWAMRKMISGTGRNDMNGVLGYLAGSRLGSRWLRRVEPDVHHPMRYIYDFLFPRVETRNWKWRKETGGIVYEAIA